MNWVSGIPSIISFLTLIMVVVELISNTKQRKIDRQVEVTLKERRRMQQELFKNVLGIIEIDREVQYEKLLKDKSILFHEMLNYKVGVWINLNRENCYSKELRSSCNSLSFWDSHYLDITAIEDTTYFKVTNLDRQHIWVLIDKYIEEEERLNKLIVAGKKIKA